MLFTSAQKAYYCLGASAGAPAPDWRTGCSAAGTSGRPVPPRPRRTERSEQAWGRFSGGIERVDAMTTKIEGPGRGTPAGRVRRSERPVDSAAGLDFERALRGFLSDAAEEADSAAAAGDSQAVGGLGGLLAAQEAGAADDATGRRQRKARLVQRGEDMLERLEEVRLGLLLGAIPKDRLMELASMVRQKREQGPDRQLDALLDEIELRAEVELAKLARAGA